LVVDAHNEKAYSEDYSNQNLHRKKECPLSVLFKELEFQSQEIREFKRFLNSLLKENLERV
jgi:hypothetical protein